MKKMLWLLVSCLMLVTACSSGNSNSSGKENHPNNGSEGGEQQITLRIIDWSDSVKTIREQFHQQFMEKYPHIKIEYTMLTVDQYKNTVLTAINAGEAPDLFPVPQGMKLATLVENGWYQSLEPYIDESFKSLFIDGVFQNGTTMVNNEIYAIPETMTIPNTLIFYNKQLFREAGLDPDNPPATYEAFIAAAKKITEAGNGKYYGFIEGGMQNNRWLATAQDWSSLAGEGLNSLSPVNLATGTIDFNRDALYDVFAMFETIKQDGSYHPKTMSISAPEARALFGQGQAGFIIQGSWSIAVWNKENPTLEYGVMAPPVPEDGRKGSLPILNPSPWIGLSATSKHPEAAALYLKEYYGGDFFQKARVQSGEALSIVKDINEQNIQSEQLADYYELAKEYGRYIPDPNIKNPQVSALFTNFKDVSPSLGELLGGVFSGAVTDYKTKLEDYTSQMQAAWDNAMEAAKAEGAAISDDDFKFPDWKPMEDYFSY